MERSMSLEAFSDQPVVIAIVAAALLLVVAVVALALFRRKPEQMADRSMDDVTFWNTPDHAPEPGGQTEPVLLFAADIAAESWRVAEGGPANVDVSGGVLRIGHGEGALSARSAPAEAGRVYVCEFATSPMLAEDDGPVNFHVGPVMTDANGRLIRYWIEQPPFQPGEGVRRGHVEIEAPPEAASVHVGVHGSWLADGRHGHGGVAFSSLRLYVR
jgi:hypothetical protein